MQKYAKKSISIEHGYALVTTIDKGIANDFELCLCRELK